MKNPFKHFQNQDESPKIKSTENYNPERLLEDA